MMQSVEALPQLEPGDHLTRAEFHRRYLAMPKGRKAELINGVVHMPSPVSRSHGKPHAALLAWLYYYEAHRSRVEALADTTVKLDFDNELQPGVLLRVLPERGGQTRDEDDYVLGAPELVGEITRSTASYDLYGKKEAYRRQGSQEYFCWLTQEKRILWWFLDQGTFRAMEPVDGILKSRTFPGLWLDVAAILAGDAKKMLATLEGGLASASPTA